MTGALTKHMYARRKALLIKLFQTALLQNYTLGAFHTGEYMFYIPIYTIYYNIQISCPTHRVYLFVYHYFDHGAFRVFFRTPQIELVGTYL